MYGRDCFRGSPERVIFGRDTAWQESPLADVLDVNDPDFRYVADAIKLMRIAGLDMTDPTMLQLAVEAGHRKAAEVHDDSLLLGHDIEQRDWSRADERGIELPERCRPDTTVVYYMRLGNRVKIGWTSNLRSRLINIQPEELLVTEQGGPKLETQRHEQFEALHVVGEWFRLEPPLTEHVARLRAAAARPSA